MPSPSPDVRAARDARWDPLIAVLCAYVVLDIGRLHVLFPALQPLRPTLLAAAAAVALCGLSRRVGRELSALRHPALYLAAGMFVWAGLSVPGGVYPGASFRFLFPTFAQTLVMALVIALAVRGPRDVKRLLFAFFLAALIYAAVVLVRFQIAPGERLSELYTYDANDLALLIVCAVPFSLYLILRSPWVIRRAAAIGALVTLAVVLVWTGSRGGFLALVMVLLVLLFSWKFIRLPWRLLAVGTGCAVFLVAANQSYWSSMSDILKPSDDYNLTSINGRVQVWKRGLGYMNDNPVFGVGLNAFPSADGRFLEAARAVPPGKGVKWSAAHNSFLQVGAELGIPGLVMFSAFAWLLLRTALRLSRPPPRLPPPGPTLAGLLVSSLAGFFVAAFFLSQAYGSIFYFFAALVLGLHRLAVRETRTARRRAAVPAGPGVPAVPAVR